MNYLATLLLTLTVLSATQAAEGRPALTVQARNKAVARQFLEEAFGPHWKIDLVDKLHTTDFVLHTIFGDVGLKEDREALKGWKVAVPDMIMSVEDIVADGDMVAVRWTATGTNTGEGNGLPATGKKVRAGGMTFWRMKDGRIAEEWGVVDMLTVLRQLGLFPEKRNDMQKDR